MAKSKRKLDNAGSKQLSLIDLIQSTKPAPVRPGAYDIASQVREWLIVALKGSPDSRHMAAAKISELTGQEIHKTTLDAWTAESKESHRVPAELIPAICQVTGDWGAFDILAEPAGGRFFRGRSALVAEAGQLNAQIKEMQRRQRELDRRISEIPDGEAE